MKRSYPKIKLTDDEIDFVCLMADTTRCGWFSLAGLYTDIETGKKLHWKSDDYDCVYDLELGHFVSLQFGLKNLMEAFELPDNMSRLTTDERKIWNRLCSIVNEVFPKSFS